MPAPRSEVSFVENSQMPLPFRNPQLFKRHPKAKSPCCEESAESAVDRVRRASDGIGIMTDRTPAPIVAAEGWHVLHLFYKVEQGAWSMLSQEEQFSARTRLS